MFTSIKDQPVFWNTKCMYTEHGQRMGAVWDGTHIHYVDVDRMCSGSFRCTTVDSQFWMEQYVQVVYDRPIGHRHCILPWEEREALEKLTKEKAPSLKDKQ